MKKDFPTLCVPCLSQGLFVQPSIVDSDLSWFPTYLRLPVFANITLSARTGTPWFFLSLSIWIALPVFVFNQSVWVRNRILPRLPAVTNTSLASLKSFNTDDHC